MCRKLNASTLEQYVTMTTPIVPDFIFDLFRKEIGSIVNKALAVIANEYDLNLSHLKTAVEKRLDLNLDIQSEQEEKIRILKIKPRAIPEPENRCIARIKDIEHGGYMQCRSRRVEYGCELCKRHKNKSSKYGTIMNPVEADKNTSRVRPIRTIY